MGYWLFRAYQSHERDTEMQVRRQPFFQEIRGLKGNEEGDHLQQVVDRETSVWRACILLYSITNVLTILVGTLQAFEYVLRYPGIVTRVSKKYFTFFVVCIGYYVLVVRAYSTVSTNGV